MPRRMNEKKPLLSLGMPVFNGENFLSKALASVLGQSFGDFELLVSDNASTDKTAEICASYARIDQRIQYSRNSSNIGLVDNHNKLVGLARGEYFMWIAHDDVLDQAYVARCVDMLQHDPDAVLCFANTTNIDEQGHTVREPNPNQIPSILLQLDSPDPIVRFRNIIQLNHQCQPIYGIIRTQFLKQTRLNGKYADSDRVLLAELALRGRFLMIRDALFIHREHQQRSVYAYRSRQARTVLMDPSQAGKIVFPYWREFWEFLASVRLSPLSRIDRFTASWEMVKWMKKYRAMLLWDLRVAALDIARKILPAPLRHAIKRLVWKRSQVH